MNNPKSVNILWILDQLVNSLKPFASVNNINLRFESGEKTVTISYLPQELLNSLMLLLVRMLATTRAGGSIVVSAEFSGRDPDSEMRVLLENSGVLASDLLELTKQCGLTALNSSNGGIYFEWLIPVDRSEEKVEAENDVKNKRNGFLLPSFYIELRKHLQFHFSKPENLVELLSRQNPKASAFLQNVNQCIQSNISDPQLDANRLSRLMHVSRIQLYRKLKPLIKQSPANYIRSLRLQKAKELLETTELRVSEIAYQTGFQSPSHFTHLFIQNYGVRPSLFSRTPGAVTNE